MAPQSAPDIAPIELPDPVWLRLNKAAMADCQVVGPIGVGV